MNLSITLVASLFASSAFASANIEHIFAPNVSQSFNVSSSVSRAVSLTDANGKAVTLTTAGQLIPAGVSASSLSASDVQAMNVSKLKVDYDSKQKLSYVQISSSKGKQVKEEDVRFYLPSKVQMDFNMEITGLSSDVATPAQSEQGVSASLIMSPGDRQNVDDTNPNVACTYQETIQSGQDCDTVTDKDGKTSTSCTPHYDTITLNGTQSCETSGQIWTDTYNFAIGSSAQFQFDQNYNTVSTSCTVCQ